MSEIMDSSEFFTTKSSLALSQLPKKLNMKQIHTVRTFDNRRKEFLNSFCFDKAKEMSKKKAEYVTQIQNFHKNQELERQKGEVDKFHQIFQKRKAKTIQEWDQIKEKEKKKWDSRSRKMDLLHTRERNDYRDRYNQKSPKIRYSKLQIDLLNKERALIRCDEYDKMKTVRSHRLEVEEKEKKEIIKTYKLKHRIGYKRLIDRQKWDLDNFSRKKKRAMIALEKKRKLRHKLLKQQKKNMMFDMTRSHRLELSDIRIQRNRRTRSSSQSNMSRSEFAESFYGSNMETTRRPKTARSRMMKSKSVSFADRATPRYIVKRPSTSRGSRKRISSKYIRPEESKKELRKKSKRRFSSSSYFGSILYDKEIAKGKKVVIPSLVDLYLLNQD